MKIKALLKVMFITYLFSAILLVVLAFILYKFGLSESRLSLGIKAVYCLSGFAGGFLVGKAVETKKYLYGILVGVLYFAALVLLSVIINKGYNSDYKTIITQLAICLASGMIGGALA